MKVTIAEGHNSTTILLKSNDARFKREWGEQVECRTTGIYVNLAMIANWVNNTYHEECLFEVD